MRNDLNKRDNETVSVIMAVYNCEETVGEAIESILNQTYKDIQLVICNDCSADNTAQVVKEYADKYPDKIVSIENETNMKLPYSLNHCLEYATGKYIARMDGDDYSYPERFEAQVNYLKEHEDVDLVGCEMDIYNGKEVVGRATAKNKPGLDDVIWSPFKHATIMTYAYVYEELGGYSLEKRAIRVEDADLWIRFYEKGLVGENINEAYYRVLEDENTISRRKLKDRINGIKTIRFAIDTLGLSKKVLIIPILKLPVALIPRPVYKILHNMKSK